MNTQVIDSAINELVTQIDICQKGITALRAVKGLGLPPVAVIDPLVPTKGRDANPHRIKFTQKTGGARGPYKKRVAAPPANVTGKTTPTPPPCAVR